MKIKHTAPLARWDWSGQRDFCRIIEQVERDAGVPVTVREKSKPPAPEDREERLPGAEQTGPG